MHTFQFGCFLLAVISIAHSDDTVWEGDDKSSVVHLGDSDFEDYIKENNNVFAMFYAPWCGHCKKMKPQYIEAANEVNLENTADGKIVAVDCTLHPQTQAKYGIKGYPTLKFFKDGKEAFAYKGQRNKAAIVNFMKDPKEAPTEPPPVEWSSEDNMVDHLTDETFDNFLTTNPSVLVMFYAPWCGHCKRMKPDYAAVASVTNLPDGIGKVAAIDCTKSKTSCKKYEVKGYPTLKYFKNGIHVNNYDGARTQGDLLSFMMQKSSEATETVTTPAPVKATPAPTKAEEWKDTPSNIHHLDSKSFDDFIAKNDALVMFYAPWCGHCKNMKPAYAEAAKELNENNARGKLAAVDATQPPSSKE